MKKDKVSIFILIDALGWNYIENRSFLDEIVNTKQRVKSILGFSSGVIPSILTGKYPQEHKHWSLYYYSKELSPFRWVKNFLWLPDFLINNRVSRKLVEEVSKRAFRCKGYFETYVIPIKYLLLFDIYEKRNIYQPGAIRGAFSLFDVLKKQKVDYKCYNYTNAKGDMDILSLTEENLRNSSSPFYFLYLCESDAMLHRHCKNSELTNSMIDKYEKCIYQIYKSALENFKKVNLFVISDHGMAPVTHSFDIQNEIKSLGLRMPEDYAVFYDATMARFWFFNDRAKEKIILFLKGKSYGKILSEKEMKENGCYFLDDMYGEVIFLMNDGYVINPSFMGNRAPEGMHGYGVENESMDATFLSNSDKDYQLKDVKDFFAVFVDEIKNE